MLRGNISNTPMVKTHLLILTTAIIAILTIANAKFNAKKNVKFELYTRDHNREKNEYEILKASNERAILNTKWRSNRPTRMYIHGYLTTRETFFKFRDKFLALGDYNFIAVNWLKGSRTLNYNAARKLVGTVRENYKTTTPTETLL